MMPTIQNILPILKAAGKVILDVYNNEEIRVDYKEDESPLTQADTAANNLIVAYLKDNFSFPIVSEEGKQIPYSDRADYKSFWLVDPLDGTKEFINRNGEFTVNIALVTDGVPVFGGIYVPVQDTYYFGSVQEGAFMKKGDGELKPMKVNDTADWIAVGSKSHAKQEESNFYESIGVSKAISVGSSLKFCMIASGQANVYYRSGPTMEWDIAAGHAIVNAAGGGVYKDLEGKEIFTYNKKNLLNGPFLCASNLKFVQPTA
ncbi:MAG: 3'(2'), 5'-bisphosphate nucleotidase [Saprospiraceae bacterium]|jgi:3'(2'), 5'-bisphosphate nucleotidase